MGREYCTFRSKLLAFRLLDDQPRYHKSSNDRQADICSCIPCKAANFDLGHKKPQDMENILKFNRTKLEEIFSIRQSL